MKDNDSWATRRALPTLGKDTWSSHIALAYQTATVYDTDGTTVITPAKGYLYLGAEYPGETPSTAEPAAAGDSGSGDSGSGDGGTTPTDTETPADPYTNPVVVARFMYAAPTKYPSGTAEEITAERAATKTALETAWTTGNWDDDWTINKILTIAPDDIALESPAQFPFAYYGADFSERAYMKTFPTPAPTTGVTATPAAVHTVFASGSRIAEADRLTKDDIEIVLGQGASAKLTGGLSLSDIFVIVFLDWDDTIIGTMTAGLNGESTDVVTDVNSYVKQKLIYPSLRDLPYDTMTDEDLHSRENSYRGEYPFSGPVGTTEAELTASYGNDTVEDGPTYPVTNKLEYTLAGKKIFDDAPFAGGWTKVITQDIDYDAENTKAIALGESEPYPGLIAKLSPRSMGNTWTALDKGVLLEKMPLLNSSGEVVDDSGTPLAVQPTIQDNPVYSFDFSSIKTSEIDDGVIYVKAVYETGTNINGNSDNTYHTFGPLNVYYISESGGSYTYAIEYQYKRINRFGYGPARLKKPGVGMTILPLGGTNSTTLGVFPENSDTIDVQLTPSDAIETVDYVLRETYNDNVITGGARSERSKLGQVTIGGPYGKAYNDIAKPILEAAYDYSHGVDPPSTTWLTAEDIFAMKLSSDEYGSEYTSAKQRRTCQTVLMDLVTNADTQGVDYTTLSWYQIQYACCNGGAYASNTKAKKYCDKYPILWDVFIGNV